MVTWPWTKYTRWRESMAINSPLWVENVPPYCIVARKFAKCLP